MADWIKGAVKHPGLFGKEAKAHHMSTRAFAHKEAGAPGKMGQRARFAEEMESHHGFHAAGTGGGPFHSGVNHGPGGKAR